MRPASASPRLLQAEDLTSLIDIGDPSPAFDSGGLSESPDGRYLAFPIRQADPVTNSYCLGIVRLSLTGDGPPILLDTSNELVRGDTDFLGTLRRNDYPIVIKPKWSPDGHWIAFEKSTNSQIQLWRVRADGSSSQPIAGADGFLLDFRWLDSNTILTISRAGLAQAERAIDDEGARGYLYDERYLPGRSDRPNPLTPPLNLYQVVSVATGVTRLATDQERGLFSPEAKVGALQVATGRNGNVAWTLDAYPDRFGSDSDLHVTFGNRPPLHCDVTRCNRVVGMWWSSAGDSLVFLRREGWAKSRIGIYVWRRGQKAPRNVLATDDLLLDCQLISADLLCAHETALHPRTIAQISLRTAQVRTLYDPNPGFSRFTLGRSERLHWRNANGFEVFGDLVYPVGYERGKRYPTIVTTYTSQGFLRGATGDEYPIQLFANHGFAVLSFARPKDVGIGEAGVSDASRQHVAAYANWADRRSVQSAIEGGLRLLESKGLIDRNRIGISGLSDGSSTVQFALLNSRIFAAAAASHCCFDAHTTISDFGLPTGDYFRRVGLPSLDAPQVPVWADMSVTLSGSRVTAPLLIQTDSDEFRGALSSLRTLREYHKPFEMYVFPGEGHIKLQPSHRLAIYRRNLAWFEFWLQDRNDRALVGDDEIARWTALRTKRALADQGGGGLR